jgi:outer membrane protein
MKQKLILLSILITIFTFAVSAQTEKGSISISGRSSFEGAYFSNRIKGANINISDRYAMSVDGYSITITPSIGYFVIDNLSVGAQSSFSITDGDYQSKTSQFVLMPTVAYYFPTKGPVKPFVAIGAGYTNISMELSLQGSNVDNMSFGGFAFAGGAGAAFFVRNNISIDLMLEYAEVSAKYSKDSSYKYSTKGLGGSIGFSFYF